MIEWERKGLRFVVNNGNRGNAPELAINCALHSRLHQCATCRTHWEQNERYADVLSVEEALELYPDAFLQEVKK